MSDCCDNTTQVVTQTATQTVKVKQPVVVRRSNAALTVVRDPVQVQTTVRSPVTVTEQVTHTGVVVDAGPPGPPGPAGPPGPVGGSAIEMVAITTIHGLRAVRAVGGQISHPDTDEPDHAEQVIGVALQSGTGVIQVQVSGLLTEGSWTWAPALVYCGDDGVLTQSPAATGWLLAVGRAIAADTIEIDIDTVFYRG